MSKLFCIRHLLIAGVLTGCFALSGNARASVCYSPQYIVKTVIVYVEIEQPSVAYVTLCDGCGKPYQVRVTRYKTVTVPVAKKVRVYL